MKLLTSEQANEVLVEAYKQLTAYPTYRMGQAIYNLIQGKYLTHEELVAVPDHYKWYNSTDSVWCIEYLFQYLVEKN